MNVRELDALQLDALREVASMGAGHAATALSQLVGRRIMVRAPRIRVVPLESVSELGGDPGRVIAAVLMQVLGDLTGRTIQVFPGQTASRLAGVLLGRESVAFPEGFADLERSALKEAGNILAGAYLNALSDFMGMILLTSVPGLAIDQAGAVLTSSQLTLSDDAEDLVFCIDTQFFTDDAERPLHAQFLLLPDAASLHVMLHSLHLA
jgi:chemotaxis protein CheC